MARLTEVAIDKILSDYHTNKYSQRELSKKHSVSLGTISKLTKEVNPKNEHIVNAQIEVLKGESELSDTEMNAVMNTANKEARRLNLVFGAVEKAVKKMDDIIESGYVEDKINVGDGMQKFEKRALNTSDVKSAIDGYDKASVTLKVSDRFANSQVVVNTQTNLQNNAVQLTSEEAKKVALDLGVPLSALQ